VSSQPSPSSLLKLRIIIRELKQRRRRRRGQRLVKNESIAYERNSWLSRSVRYANGFENVLSYICNDGVQFQMEKRKISRRCSCFVGNAKLCDFTLLFCRGRQRNVQRLVTHVQLLFCLLNLLFGAILVTVVVVICLSSLSARSRNQSDCRIWWITPALKRRKK